jgi:DNA-binding MarR family transcriptional regulator
MFELSRTPRISQRELAVRLHLEKSTVSRLAKMLEQRGWLDRSRDESDSRLFRLHLTPAGSKAVQRLSASRRAHFGKTFEAIPANKRDALIEALSLLSEALNES